MVREYWVTQGVARDTPFGRKYPTPGSADISHLGNLTGRNWTKMLVSLRARPRYR